MRRSLLTLLVTLGLACHGETVAATTDSGATDDAPPGGSNLLVNGDFESGCAAWPTDYGTLTVVTAAHGGKSACMVCGDRAYQISQDVDGSALVVGKKYVAEAWIRRGPSDSGASTHGFVATAAFDAKGDSMGTSSSGNFPLTDDFQRVTAVLTYGAGAKSAGIRIGSTDPNTCIVVDDAAFRALP